MIPFETIAERLGRYFGDKPVSKAYIFGSYADGIASRESDIDILVELDEDHMLGLAFIEMQLELEELFGVPVDLVSSKGLSKYISEQVASQKRVVYER